MWWLREPLLEFRDPSNISRRIEGSCGGHVAHFWNFGTLNISGTVEARNFKFGTESDDNVY